MARSTRTDPRVDLVIAAFCGMAALACLILPAKMRDSAAARLRGTVMAPFASLQAKAELSRTAFMTHDAAVRVADSVTLRSLLLAGVQDENERLRRLVGFAPALKWGFVPAEALHGRGLGDDFTVTLSAGRGAGVEPFSPVVVPEGIVGLVERVDEALSVAIIWPHPDFRVSAMTADGSAFGIVSSHDAPGSGRYYLEFRGVPLRVQLKPGTLVVSSGFGGVFPKGIPVGTIIQELKTVDGYPKSFLLRPAVRLQDVTSVMILKPPRVQAGMEGVWANAMAADSQSKGMMRAADSLVVMARRRMTDSLVAALKLQIADSLAKLPKPDTTTRTVKRDSTVRPPRRDTTQQLQKRDTAAKAAKATKPDTSRPLP